MLLQHHGWSHAKVKIIIPEITPSATPDKYTKARNNITYCNLKVVVLSCCYLFLWV